MYSITQYWDGSAVALSDVIPFGVSRTDTADVQISFFLQLAKPYIPDAPAGFMHGLWDYDVFEVFAVRPDGTYIEIEVGPGGHYLVYTFSGYRQRIEEADRLLSYTYSYTEGTWKGTLAIPHAWLGADLGQLRWNFYAIRHTHGTPEYCAWRSVPSVEADFHRTECFDTIET